MDLSEELRWWSKCSDGCEVGCAEVRLDVGRVRSKSPKTTRLFWQHKETKRTVHFPTLMDICHLKNAELEPKYQKYKGRVVLRGDTVKDDSVASAPFTEQGSSASHMTATKVMNVIVRLPDCAGQAADAISAHTQLKMEAAPRLLKIPKSACSGVWVRRPRHR